MGAHDPAIEKLLDFFLLQSCSVKNSYFLSTSEAIHTHIDTSSFGNKVDLLCINAFFKVISKGQNETLTNIMVNRSLQIQSFVYWLQY